MRLAHPGLAAGVDVAPAATAEFVPGTRTEASRRSGTRRGRHRPRRQTRTFNAAGTGRPEHAQQIAGGARVSEDPVRPAGTRVGLAAALHPERRGPAEHRAAATPPQQAGLRAAAVRAPPPGPPAGSGRVRVAGRRGFSSDASSTWTGTTSPTTRCQSETRHEHLAELRRLYGFRSFSGGAARELADRLREEAEQARSNEDLVRRFVEACRRTRTILPATTTIHREPARTQLPPRSAPGLAAEPGEQRRAATAAAHRPDRGTARQGRPTSCPRRPSRQAAANDDGPRTWAVPSCRARPRRHARRS